MAPVTVEGSPKTLEGPGWDNSEAVKFTAVGLLLPEIRVPSEVGTLAIGAASASAHPLSATSMPLARGGPGSLREKADDEQAYYGDDERLPFSDCGPGERKNGKDNALVPQRYLGGCPGTSQGLPLSPPRTHGPGREVSISFAFVWRHVRV